MSNNTNNPLLYVLVILVSINLAGTAYIIANHSQAITKSSKVDIPEDKSNILASKVVKRYNSKDYDDLYQLFDPLAKAQITQDTLTKQIKKLHSLVGRIDTFAYSHSVNAGNQGGHTYYQLIYKVRISGGALDTGEMKLTVLNKNGRLGLMGLFINALSNNYEK